MEQRLQKKSVTLFFWAVATCLVITLFSGHAFQTILSFKDYVLFGACAVALVCLLVNRKIFALSLPKGALLLFLGMVLCTFIVSLGGGWWSYLLLTAMLIVSYTVTEYFTFRDVVKVYVNIMTVVSVTALVGYILVQNTNVLNVLPTMTNANGVDYGVGILFNYILVTPERNCGMFWEPGLFATHLTIAMVIEILRPQKTSFWRLLLFSACVFTANSSAGFVLWFLCMLLLLVKSSDRKLGPLPGILSIAVLGAAIVLILNFDTILSSTALSDNEYFGKLSSDSVEGSSRALAFAHNFELFASNPIFGAGFSAATSNMANVADTSTPTYLLSVFGLPAILYTVFWVYGIAKLRGVNIFSKIVILVIAFVILNKEPHYQILFTWCLLFYLLKLAKQPVPDTIIMVEEAAET